MNKNDNSQASGNFFRKIVKDVFKEEFGPIEERLLGVERRLDGIEKICSDNHHDLVRAENQLFKLQDSFIRFEDKITNSFREFQSTVQGLLDPLMKELIANRQEQTILNGRSAKINKIEDQVEALQKIHPGGLHASV